MGAVYKARQSSLDRLVAVKVLPPEAGRDPAFAERFGREARALARLSHPNIVAVHDVGKAGDYYYFVMEYVEGVNLRQLLRDGQLRPEHALRLVPQICDALQYAHEEGVVHRDVKPENILLDRKGRVKIADFGLAKLLGRDTGNFTLTGSRQVMGTLYYMAPEQIERPLEVDHRADIYSLGVVFYEMLTGQLPVGRFAMPSEKAGTDAFFDEVVLHALEREPAKRYQHASEVKTDVESHTRWSPDPRPETDAAGKAEAHARAAWSAGLIGLFVPIVVGSLTIVGTIVAVLNRRPGEDIATPLMVAWSVAGVVVVVVTVGSLNVIRGLRRQTRDEQALARAGRAAGLIGLFVPVIVVSLAVVGTIVAVLTRLPGEEMTTHLILAWSIVAVVVLVVIVQSLKVIAQLPQPTGDAQPRPPGREGRVDSSPAAVRVRRPALALLVTGGLHAVLQALFVLLMFFKLSGTFDSPRPVPPGTSHFGPLPTEQDIWPYGLPLVLSIFVGPLIIIGAVNMLHLRSFGWALAAAILALLPCGPSWLLVLPAGIWALVVLTAPDVKAAFARHAP